MKVVEAHNVKHLIMEYARYERDHIAVVTEGLRNADVLGITRARLAVEFEVKVSRSDLNKELAAIKYASITMTDNRNFAPADDDPEQMALNIELGQLKQKAGGWSKISKHEEYTDPKKYFEKHQRYMLTHSYIPNYFYVVVPDKLATYAIEQLQGTKYGVIAYDGCRAGHYGYKLADSWYPDRADHPADARWTQGLPCELAGDRCYKEVAVKKKASLIHKEKIGDGVITSILTRAVTENIRMMGEIVEKDKRIKELELVTPAPKEAEEGR